MEGSREFADGINDPSTEPPTSAYAPETGSSVEFALPLVSILITNHNYARFVGQAIQSVHEQIYKNIECIIVDDCSTDDSIDVIAKTIRDLNHPGFRLVRLADNRGQMGAMKAALEHAGGTFVTFLDADDFLLPHFVSQHVAAHLNTAYSAGLTASDTIQVDDRGALLEGTFHTVAKRRTSDPSLTHRPIDSGSVPDVTTTVTFNTDPEPALTYVDREAIGWFGAACSAYMFRKDVLNLIVPDDDSDFRICADYHFVSLAHYLSGTLVIADGLSCWRLHGGNSFSINPVLGGPYDPGNFVQKPALDAVIARFLLDRFDQLAACTTPDRIYRLIRQHARRSDVYEFALACDGFRRIAERGKPWRFWLKYGVLHRLLKRQ